MNCSIERGKSVRRPACEDESSPEGGQHVCFTILRTGLAGQAKCGPELTDPRAYVTDIAKDDPSGLVSY